MRPISFFDVTTTTLYSFRGGYIDANNATYVNSDYITTYWSTGQFGGSQKNRALLVFDLSPIRSNATINSATLKITVHANFLGTSHTLNFYRVKRKWMANAGQPSTRIDSKASWNNYNQAGSLAWTTAGCGDTTNDRDSSTIGTLSVTSATSGQKSVTLDASMVQAWVDGSYANNGILVQASDETNTTLIRWKGTGDATPANRPQIDVDWTAANGETLLTSLVGYWMMDEASGNLADATGNGHALAPTNTPTQTTGIIGSGQNYARTSSQYHSNSDTALRATGDWTWAGWVKLTDKSAVNYYTAASQQGTGVNAGWSVFYHTTALDYYVFQIYGASGSVSNPVADVIGRTSPTTGQWMFLVCRNDATRGNIAQLFCNAGTPGWWGDHDSGAEGSAAFTYPGGIAQSTAAYTLGYSTGPSPHGYMNGDIDEVGYWSRCLSNAEITSLYASGAGLQYPFGLSIGQPSTKRWMSVPFATRRASIVRGSF